MKLLVAAGLIGVTALTANAVYSQRSGDGPTVTAEAVTRGAIVSAISATGTLETADVARRSAGAQVKAAAAQVTQARASLRQADVNMSKTVIKSPIDGIVIARNVDVGQTVAASLSAPVTRIAPATDSSAPAPATRSPLMQPATRR